MQRIKKVHKGLFAKIYLSKRAEDHMGYFTYCYSRDFNYICEIQNMNDAFSFLLEVFYFGNMQTLKWRVKMDKRIGVVGIVVEDINSANEVNAILHDYSHIIVGRMGIPYREKEVSVISLIVDGSSDEISAMTGKLGRVKDVSVKSAMAKKI